MCQIKETLRQGDNGRRLQLKVGEGFSVELDEIATAGYQWHSDLAQAVPLEQTESRRAPYPGAAAGAGTLRVFTFCARGPGRVLLGLSLRRAWQGGGTVGHFTVDVEVVPQAE